MTFALVESNVNLADLFKQIAVAKLDVYAGVTNEPEKTTPNTPSINVGVTLEPAPDLAITAITPVTPKTNGLVDLSAPWTEEEVLLTKVRTERFVNKGLGYESADILACDLVARDRQLDDRCICCECQHLLYSCTQGLEPIGGDPRVLHRCAKFEAET